MVKNVAGTWCCDSHNVNRVISGLKVTGIRERPKFMGVPGPGLSTGGGDFFSGKKRGRRLFFSEKKGAPSFSAKKRGHRVFFCDKKGGNDFFQEKRGGEEVFWHTRRGGKTFFSSESRGANTFFLGWKVVQDFFCFLGIPFRVSYRAMVMVSNKFWVYCWIDISCLKSGSFRANMGLRNGLISFLEVDWFCSLS